VGPRAGLDAVVVFKKYWENYVDVRKRKLEKITE
jgi:hypothetical protein